MEQSQSDNNLKPTSEDSSDLPPDTSEANDNDPHHNSEQSSASEKQPPTKDSKPTQSTTRPQTKGVAALFGKEELKNLLLSYLGAIFVIEGFIFFVSFLSQIGPKTTPFPWKSYFFTAFTIPLAITFLLGIIVLSFDRYIFGPQNLSSEINELFQSASETRSRIHKLHASLHVVRQFPFLLGLLSLLALSVIAYKLNDILAVIGLVGERTAHYLFIGMAVGLTVAVVVGLIWMFLSYNLRKKTLEYQFQYKKEVIDKTGLILIGEDRVMNQDGRVLSFNNIHELSGKARPDEDPKTMIIDQS
ncbi:hypothetical protein KAI46_11495 [bacterium]|nr:hypothetical protein [bacterium]